MAGVLLVIIIVGIILMNLGDDDRNVNYQQSKVDANNENVIITVSDVDDGKFHYYSYDSKGTEIKYFAVQSDDGSIHTAFDACDVCYHAKKGYTQDGNKAKCQNCGLTYPIDDLGTKNTGGGCWPGMLPHTIENGNVLIKISDLENGLHYFE